MSIAIVTANFLKLGIGELLARALSFFALIYIARILGPEMFGIIGLAGAIILYFNRLTDFGIELLGPSEVAKNSDHFRNIFSSILYARLILACLSVCAIVVAGLLLMPTPDGSVLIAYSFTLLAVGGSSRWIHIGIEKPGYVSIARSSGEILRFVIIILFVHKSTDILHVPFAQIMGDSLTTIMMLWRLRHDGFRLKPRFSWTDVSPVFKNAWPLMLTPLLGLIIYSSDIIILKFYGRSDEVGFYMAAYTLIAFIANMAGLYNSSLLPTLSRLSKTEDSNQQDLFDTSMAHVFAIGCPLAVGGYVLASEIIHFGFGSEYDSANMILQILIWSIPFLMLRSVMQTLLISRGRQIFLLRLTFLMAVFNVGANLMLIPRYGMAGAAATTLLTEFFRMLLAQKYVLGEGYRYSYIIRFWRPFISASIMALLLMALHPSSVILGIAIGVVTYLVVLALIGGIRFKQGQLPTLAV